MTEELKEVVFVEVDLHIEANNDKHRTSEISLEQLVLRRGHPFDLTIELEQPFDPKRDPLILRAQTGSSPTEEAGTLSIFGVPERVTRSPAAKAVWMITLDPSSVPQQGILELVVTPPADAPIGEYSLTVEHKSNEAQLATLVLLFNPWCPGDSVFLSDEQERHEYVMKEDGVIFQGSSNHIEPYEWDFGQFEDHMLEICMKILDLNHKHAEDPAADVAARSDATYVSRVISAMINSEDDHGILEGRWEGPYWDGKSPTHWSGSHDILLKWLRGDAHPVKYGQCWVFAGVMCTVMRFLGIPCRVVTNFDSAHDTNSNLTIDTFYDDDGLRENETHDSIWNFHVWCEGWMKRPDLSGDGKFDGWQVVDPTPQELSDGVYCCGPAAVKAILHGETNQDYDVPFVFAEVNADCIEWLIKPDGSSVKFWSGTDQVGRNISTKKVGSTQRLDVTSAYKHKEGTEKERLAFMYAVKKHYSSVEEEEDDTDGLSVEDNTDVPACPKLSLLFKEETKPEKGKDVELELEVHSKNKEDMPLSIVVSVQAMKHNGTPGANIKKEMMEVTLQPDQDLSVPILIPFALYSKPMLDCESLKVSAVVTNKLDPERPYLAKDDVVLVDPPISVTMTGRVRVGVKCVAEVVFNNPINLTLTNCTLTFSGSGLLKEEHELKHKDVKPNGRIAVTLPVVPYKAGKRTLLVDLDCSSFRDIKGSCTVDVKPASTS